MSTSKISCPALFPFRKFFYAEFQFICFEILSSSLIVSNTTQYIFPFFHSFIQLSPPILLDLTCLFICLTHFLRCTWEKTLNQFWTILNFALFYLIDLFILIALLFYQWEFHWFFFYFPPLLIVFELQIWASDLFTIE